MFALSLPGTLLSLLVVIACLYHVRRVTTDLAKQRDLLEDRVAERTQELEQAQLSRLLELQRFAEFGRLSAHILHDLTSPLTAVSLNVQQLDRHDSPAAARARKSLRQLERYVQAARQQLLAQSHEVDFTIQAELRQLMSVLKPLAGRAGVELVVRQDKPIKLYGDPARFNQIMANLIVNAIDACAEPLVPASSKRVEITIKDIDRYVHITVRDWGKGIDAIQLPEIFQPFYTTKTDGVRGLGIGLSIVKRSVGEDFKGTICVNSAATYGTTFTVLLKTESKTDNQRSAGPVPSLLTITT